MIDLFHPGELAVQERAGVSSQAQKVGRIIASHMPPGADRFLAALPILFQGGVDAQGDVWASALTGDPGFATVTGPQDVEVRANPVPTDPLNRYGQPGVPAGFLAIDLATRQRFRFNGEATHADDTLRVAVNQAYGNCPKYIQRRAVTVHDAPLAAGPAVTGSALTTGDIDLIRRADTFFIASTAQGHGTDVSHRGGAPGFVRVTDQGEITFKDYAGNNMFQTLGNLTSDPRAGFLFIDFMTGDTLQISGRAEVQWASPCDQDFTDTGRSVTFTPDRVIRTPHAIPHRWVLKDYSPFNPHEN